MEPMDMDSLSSLDADLAAVLDIIAQSGFDGAIDHRALDEYARLTEQRIQLTEPPLEIAAAA